MKLWIGFALIIGAAIVLPEFLKDAVPDGKITVTSHNDTPTAASNPEATPDNPDPSPMSFWLTPYGLAILGGVVLALVGIWCAKWNGYI